MRTEIQGVPRGLLSRRVGYILDDNGSHAAAGKPAAVAWVGAKGRRDFLWVGKGGGAFQSRRSKRGAPKKFAAIEVTAHAKDNTGSKACLFPREMQTIFLSLMIQFGGVYGLAGMHGKSDGHFLIINRTVFGKALRSTFPNNATPRRVMVAVCDRLEREFNHERARLGEPPLKLMIEIRNDRDAALGRKSMHEQISQELLRNGGSVRSIVDILKAMHVLGWRAGRVIKGNVAVKFSDRTPKKNYSLDLLLRGIAAAYKRLKQRQLEKAPMDKEKPRAKPQKLSPSTDKVPRKDKDGGAESPTGSCPREATPADLAKWAERITIYVKTPNPTDEELLGGLKQILGRIHSFDPSGGVVIADPGSKVPLRIQFTQLRSACAAIWEKRRDRPDGSGELPGPSR